jgi:hypothetical protein
MGTSKKGMARGHKVQQRGVEWEDVVETGGLAVEALKEAEVQARAAERAAQAARQQRDKHVEALEGLSLLRWVSEDGAVTCGFEIVHDELMLRLAVEGHGARMAEAEARAFGGWLRAMLGAPPQA